MTPKDLTFPTRFISLSLSLRGGGVWFDLFYVGDQEL